MRPAFLHDVLTVEPYLGSLSRGPSYGPPQAVRASVQPTYRLVVGSDGREATASALAIVWPGSVFPVESRATASDGRVFRILEDSPTPDARRPDHREILLGSIA